MDVSWVRTGSGSGRAARRRCPDSPEYACQAQAVLSDMPQTQLVVLPGAASVRRRFAAGRVHRKWAPLPLTGRRAAVLAELVRDLGVWLLPDTLYERGDDGGLYNTAVVFSRS